MLGATEEDAKVRYEIRREIARAATLDRFRDMAFAGEAPIEAIECDFTSITNAALDEAEGWRFPWRRIVGQNRPYLRRFELAVWHGGQLYALCVGRASRGNNNVTIHFLERFSGKNPFKGWVGQVTADAADTYAKLIERQWVKLKNPLEGAIPLYRDLGFTLAEPYRGSTYYERRVS
jgi:hypothetical protein